MRLVAIGFLIFLSTGLPLTAQPQRGTMCVAPVSPERPQRISPGGDYNPATLTVRIDKRKSIVGPHKDGIKIEDLDVGGRHVAVLTPDGKRIQSFWFRFSDYETPDLCLSFDGYQGVDPRGRKYMPWCNCK